MSSFAVQIEDMKALLDCWADMLGEVGSGQTFTANENVFATLGLWPRLRWFYYCDDQDGNTVRLYDSDHFSRFGSVRYLEAGLGRKEHSERVILRGKSMWGEGGGDLKQRDSLRNRFRRESPWRIFSAGSSPLRPETRPPAEKGFPPIRDALRGRHSIDIRADCRRDLRLWYFEAVNRDPPFEASSHEPDYGPATATRPARSPTTETALRRLLGQREAWIR